MDNFSRKDGMILGLRRQDHRLLHAAGPTCVAQKLAFTDAAESRWSILSFSGNVYVIF